MLRSGTAPDGAVVVPWGVFEVAVVSADEPDEPILVASAARAHVLVHDLLTHAAENTWMRELKRLDVRSHSIGNGRTIRVLATDDGLYVPFVLTGLVRFLDVEPLAGAFVTAPAHDMIAVYSLTSPSDRAILPGLAQIAASMAERNTSVLDPRVHWWNGQDVRELHAAVTDSGDVAINGPEELTAALRRLP